jgi:hypothetical protein
LPFASAERGEIFDAVLLQAQSETVFLEVDLMRLSLDK